MSKTETYTVDDLNREYSTYQGNPKIEILPGNKTGIEISRINGRDLGYLHFIAEMSMVEGSNPAPRLGAMSNNRMYQVFYYDKDGEKQVESMKGTDQIFVSTQTSSRVPSTPSPRSKPKSGPKVKSSSASRSKSSSRSRSASKSTSSGGRKKRRSSKRRTRSY